MLSICSQMQIQRKLKNWKASKNMTKEESSRLNKVVKEREAQGKQSMVYGQTGKLSAAKVRRLGRYRRKSTRIQVAMLIFWFESFICSSSAMFAETDPEIPHGYIVKTPPLSPRLLTFTTSQSLVASPSRAIIPAPFGQSYCTNIQ